MKHRMLVGALAVLFAGTASAQTPPPTTPQQKPGEKPATATQSQQSQQVTVTGCLRQTSDDPKMFALVNAQPSKEAGTQASGGATSSGQSSMRAPFYRLQEDASANLKTNVNKQVQVTGTVTPAKDEKGADIVTYTKEQTAAMTSTTVRTLDLKPAPLLRVTSIKSTGDCPAAKPGQ